MSGEYRRKQSACQRNGNDPCRAIAAGSVRWGMFVILWMANVSVALQVLFLLKNNLSLGMSMQRKLLMPC